MSLNESADRWIVASKSLDLGVAQQRVEAIADVLNDLVAQSRKVLDEDLSTVEPIAIFRPESIRGA